MRQPWYERLSWLLERYLATVIMRASCRPFSWRWGVVLFSCGWCENELVVWCGPLSFTILYFRDPAAAAAPVGWSFQWPRNQNIRRYRNVRI